MKQSLAYNFLTVALLQAKVLDVHSRIVLKSAGMCIRMVKAHYQLKRKRNDYITTGNMN